MNSIDFSLVRWILGKHKQRVANWKENIFVVITLKRNIIYKLGV